MITFKKFRDKKSLNETIRLCLKNNQKDGDPSSVKVCAGARTDEVLRL